MFKGINFKQFLSEAKEFHALVNGFCEVLCPWPPRYDVMSQDLLEEIAEEAHYYTFGRFLGVLAWIGIIIGIYKLVAK